MITIYLKDFITSGKFGPVELGMTINQVVDILGEPEGQMDYNNGHCQIQYAYYEFFYLKESQILYGIQNTHLATFPNIKTGRVNNKRDICFTNNNFTINIWFLKRNRYMTFEQVINKLENERIDFIIVNEFSDGKTLKFNSGVRIDFTDLSGLCFYHKDSNSWTYADKIQDENKQLLSGLQIYDLKLAA